MSGPTVTRAEAADRLLRDVEWSPEPSALTSTCPWCLRMKLHGHDAACELGKYLAAHPEPEAAEETPCAPV